MKSAGAGAWEEARAEAEAHLEGVTRTHLPGVEAGLELGCLDWGRPGSDAAPLVVLHHANGFCGAVWAPIAAKLRDRCHVVAIDARGHGRSTSVDPGPDLAAYDWSVLARDYGAAIDALLERTGHDRVRLAVGHSFGGVLTLGAAAERPDRFEALLLFDPVVLPPPEPGGGRGRGSALAKGALRRRHRFEDRGAAFAHFAGRGLFRDFDPAALALYVMEGLHDVGGGVELACAPTVESAIFDQARSLPIFDRVGPIQAPTVFVHAARGDFGRDVYDALARHMKDARVESFEGGHLFPMERPAPAAERIARALEAGPGGFER